METAINAELDGKIRDVLVQPGNRVETCSKEGISGSHHFTAQRRLRLLLTSML